jgi:hypothetical protein
MWRKPEPKQLFPVGQIVSTPNALDVCAKHNVHFVSLIERHATGDWGDVSPGDAALNNAAVSGEATDRLHSVYDVGGDKVWVITEWDRSVTTVLLPEDY